VIRYALSIVAELRCGRIKMNKDEFFFSDMKVALQKYLERTILFVLCMCVMCLLIQNSLLQQSRTVRLSLSYIKYRIWKWLAMATGIELCTFMQFAKTVYCSSIFIYWHWNPYNFQVDCSKFKAEQIPILKVNFSYNILE
jgi:hypothetical protein